MLVQSTSPSGVAAPRDTPCDVPDTVRLGRSRGAGVAMLVPWPSTVLTNDGWNQLESH